MSAVIQAPEATSVMCSVSDARNAVLNVVLSKSKDVSVGDIAEIV